MMVKVKDMTVEDIKVVRKDDVETMLVEVAETMAATIGLPKLNPTSFVIQYHDAFKTTILFVQNITFY